MITTHSKFYFDYEITADNYWLDFDEGAAEINAELDIGKYSMTDLATEIARAMNAVGGQTYTVSVNRSTRIFTISAAGNFTLLLDTGTHTSSAMWSIAGYNQGADQTGTNTYAGDTAAGTSYATQFWLQDYVSTSDRRAAVDGVVNESASGEIEVITFGTVQFMECNIRFATNYSMVSGAVIRNNASGVANLRTFMNYLITKGPVEFMPDEDTPSSYETFILQSTEFDSKGIAYKLREMYAQGLPNFYETGVLIFRKVD